MWGCAAQGLLPSAGRVTNYRRALPGTLAAGEQVILVLLWQVGGLLPSRPAAVLWSWDARGMVWMLVLWGKKAVCVCTLYVVGGAAVGRAVV
jgi:hypothetical protein